jgi:ribose transport system permease protein
LKTRIKRNQAIVIAYAFAVLLFVFTSIVSPGFASANNTGTVLIQASFIAIAALGQTFVIIGGGIDLSLPAVLTASAVLVTRLADGQDHNLVWIVPLLIVIGVLIGLLNGAGVAFLGVSPIIMTLGVQGIVQGALLIYTKGTAGGAPPPAIEWLSTHKWGPVPVEVLLWIVLGLVAAFLLSRTTYGRRLYALGTSATVAEFSGVDVRRTTILSYVISAVTGVIAGVLISGYVGQSYLSLGDVYLFSSIAAVAIGGASILGGSGHYAGTVAGALTLTILAALLPILHLKPAVLEIVYGVVILVTVGLATARGQEART